MSDEDHKSSWLEPLPEEFTPPEDATARRMLIAGLTVVILAIFGGLIWYSYLDGNGGGSVPIIHADNAAVKEKPDSPGGLQVPDQDKRVFDRVAPEESDQGDKLAPSAEIPLDLPVSVISPKADTAQAIAPEGPNSPVKDATITEDAAITEIVKKTVPLIMPVKTAPRTTTQALSAKMGDFLIQLGAFGKKNTAENLWHELQRDNKSLLGILRPDIMMIDLGKKGILYRLRGGMLADRSSAERICTILKAKKQACIVVVK